jgi:hypothetical protein
MAKRIGKTLWRILNAFLDLCFFSRETGKHGVLEPFGDKRCNTNVFYVGSQGFVACYSSRSFIRNFYTWCPADENKSLHFFGVSQCGV